MNKKKYYFKQPVVKGDFQVIPDNIEGYIGEALKALETKTGFVSNSENTPIEDSPASLNVNVQANSAWADESVSINNLLKIEWPNTLVDCSEDWTTASTIPSAGNKRWIACYAFYQRVESDPRIDGNGDPLFYAQDDGFELRIYMGAEAASPSKPADPAPDYSQLLFEVLLDENVATTKITNAVDPDNPIENEIDLREIIYANRLQDSNDIVGDAPSNIGKAIVVGPTGKKFVYKNAAGVTARQAVVKVDGTVNFDCDYTSIKDALDAGQRNIYMLAPKIREFSITAAAVGANAFMAFPDHKYVNGDRIVVRSEKDGSGRYVDGVFTVQNATTNQLQIALRDNTGILTGTSGGIGNVLAMVHQADKTQIDLSGIDYKDLYITAESKWFCTIAPNNDYVIVTPPASQDVENIYIENVQLTPADGRDFTSTAIYKINDSLTRDFTIQNCLLNGFKNAEENSPLYTKLFDFNVAGSKLNDFVLINNYIWGPNEGGGNVIIDLQPGNASSSHISISDNHFYKMNSITIRVGNLMTNLEIDRNRCELQGNTFVTFDGGNTSIVMSCSDNNIYGGWSEEFALMQAIRCLDAIESLTIMNNLIRDVYTGIYIDSNAKKIKISGNNIRQCDGIGIDLQTCDSIGVCNNVVADCATGINRTANSTNGIIMENILANNTSNLGGISAGSMIIADNVQT
jgi:hypothetical protein